VTPCSLAEVYKFLKESAASMIIPISRTNVRYDVLEMCVEFVARKWCWKMLFCEELGIPLLVMIPLSFLVYSSNVENM
jgi:hypothetical protein